jgi:hypothetical protein
MKKAMTGKTFCEALAGASEAKNLLRLALSPHLRGESKQAAFVSTLKACPQAARFSETSAALWVLQA